MPRDVTGTYTLPAGNPVVTATLISSVWANTTMVDLGTALTNSLDRTGVSAGMTGQFKAFAGAIGAPGISWGLDLTSGLYRNAAADYRYSVTGTDVIRFQAAGTVVLAQPGAVGTPPYTFIGDLTTGLFRVAAGDLGITLAGVQVADFQATGITLFNSSVAAQAQLSMVNTNTVAGNDIRIAQTAGTESSAWFVQNQNAAAASITGGQFPATTIRTLGTISGFQIGTNNIARLIIGGNGGVTIPAPSTALVALTITGINSANCMTITAGATANQSQGVVINAGTSATDFNLKLLNSAGGNIALFTGDKAISMCYTGGGGTTNPMIVSTAAGALNLGFSTANANQIIGISAGGVVTIGIGGTLTGAGGSHNVTINSVSSGSTLTLGKGQGAGTSPALVITGGAANTAAITVNTSATTGANTWTPTWTNAPFAAGTKNPAHWLPIILDGSLHYIPCVQ